jgi:aspartate kinase
MKTLVMKFGGAAVSCPEQFSRIADLIIARKKEYPCVLVVVSAMGGATDQLKLLAHKVHEDPPKREMDMLLSVGERVSIALLAMALSVKGYEAVSFTGSQAGIITSTTHSDAAIVQVTPCRLLPKLSEGHIVIVAGFQGVSLTKEITTLGRGGSDTSAVALAAAVGAELVEFYKDVPGVFSSDPKIDPSATQYPLLSFEQALSIVDGGAKILHPRAVRLAQKNRIPLFICSFEDKEKSSGTWIGREERCFERQEPCFEQENPEGSLI